MGFLERKSLITLFHTYASSLCFPPPPIFSTTSTMKKVGKLQKLNQGVGSVIVFSEDVCLEIHWQILTHCPVGRTDSFRFPVPIKMEETYLIEQILPAIRCTGGQDKLTSHHTCKKAEWNDCPSWRYILPLICMSGISLIFRQPDFSGVVNWRFNYLSVQIRGGWDCLGVQ